MGADARRSMAWVTLPPRTAAPHSVSALGRAPCAARQEEAGLRGLSVSCCLCPPGCWADCALMGKIGVWRPPLGLREQWEACQAGPKWPWGQIPSPWCRGALLQGAPSGPGSAATPARGRSRQAAVRGPGPGRPPWSRLAVLPRRAAVVNSWRALYVCHWGWEGGHHLQITGENAIRPCLGS